MSVCVCVVISAVIESVSPMDNKRTNDRDPDGKRENSCVLCACQHVFLPHNQNLPELSSFQVIKL